MGNGTPQRPLSSPAAVLCPRGDFRSRTRQRPLFAGLTQRRVRSATHRTPSADRENRRGGGTTRRPGALLCLLLVWLLAGCSLIGGKTDQTDLFADDPRHDFAPQPLPYTAEFVIGQTGRTAPLPEAEYRELLAQMRANSQLVQLAAEAPDGLVGLERRALADETTARNLMASQGYYAGKASYQIDEQHTPLRVVVRLNPGPRYTVGLSTVRYVHAGTALSATPDTASTPSDPARAASATPDPALPAAPPSAALPPERLADVLPEGAPHNLVALGLPNGAPAVADPVLKAVAALPLWFHQRGYPLATVRNTRYIVDHQTRTLDVETVLAPGPCLRMGQVRLVGAESVHPDYIARLKTWKEGQRWDSRRVESYRDSLQRTGLFQSIQLTPDPATQPGPEASLSCADVPPTDLLARVTEATHRSVGGGMYYASDIGFGVRGFWEHRNLMGEGESLRLTGELSQERQEMSATFRNPLFGRPDQFLVAEAALRNETSDAYDLTSAYSAIGLERRLSRRWWASLRVSAEGGRLDEPLRDRQSYALFGVPFGVRYDSTDNLLNPTRGMRFNLSLTPYTGFYDQALTALRLWTDASVYYQPFVNDRLVLAARAAAGSITGSTLAHIPPPIRFYSGGGGSVRGYKYRSLGATDAQGDPLGGLSFTEANFEARIRITESFGLVPFVDTGMVYDTTMPRLGTDLYSSAGLGFRYYSAIGPIRLDVALPLRRVQSNDKVHVYISIGQAF